MSESDWRCPVCHWGWENADHKDCLHAVCQARDEVALALGRSQRLADACCKQRDASDQALMDAVRHRDELGEAARLNAQAAAEWEREANVQAELYRERWRERDEARAVAVRLLMLGDCLVSATDDEAWNSQVHALQTDNPWLVTPPAQQPRCALCDQAKPSLDPAGVCQQCRIGPVEPAGEEFPHE